MPVATQFVVRYSRFVIGRFSNESSVPYTGEQLSLDNCAVDHTPPKTFDALLFNFCREQAINPLQVIVGSEGGTVAVLSDLELLAAWQAYHRANANLRLLSKLGNLQLSKTSVQWGNLWE